MAQPLMPKATAVWLVENTTLTFDQIAEFCNLHHLEVQGIADGEVAIGIVGLDPVSNGQISAENLELCQADNSARLIAPVAGFMTGESPAAAGWVRRDCRSQNNRTARGKISCSTS